MATIDKQAVLNRLGGIRGPDDDRDIVRRGMVSDIVWVREKAGDGGARCRTLVSD